MKPSTAIFITLEFCSDRTIILSSIPVRVTSSPGAGNQANISHLKASNGQTVFMEEQVVSYTNPFLQFHAWFQAALECKEILEPMAVCITTSTKDGKPSSRTVLMKSYTEKGFIFFSNYKSRKGKELAENPHAALLFYWPALHRQVRIEGGVQRLTEEKSARYFHSRPHMSQISATVSQQSAVIASREELEAEHSEMLQKYPDESVTIPKPPHWGGYVVEPSVFEFWEGQSAGLHDRTTFFKEKGADVWTVKREAS